MKNTTQIFNKETASRFSKSFKKNLNNMGFPVTLSQCHDVLAKSIGFQNHQSALKSDFKFTEKLKEKSYIVKFDAHINDMEYIFSHNKYCFMFIGFEEEHINFYEISKTIDLIDYVITEKSKQSFLTFLNEASLFFKFSNEKFSTDDLQLSLSNFINHIEGHPYDILFSEEKHIKLFDEIFKKDLIENKNIQFLSGHVSVLFDNFEIKTLTEMEKDTLISLNIPDRIIKKKTN